MLVVPCGRGRLQLPSILRCWLFPVEEVATACFVVGVSLLDSVCG